MFKSQMNNCNKCFNVREWVEVVVRKKHGPLFNSTVLRIISVCEAKHRGKYNDGDT